jgi:uncharacterized protein (DUF4415 family)
MKNQETDTISEPIEIKYNKQDVETLRSQGVPEDELPKVGAHKFNRSRFTVPANEAKIKITMYLDSDVLSFFKKRAEGIHSAPYQTQINAELRKVMKDQETADTNQLAQSISDDDSIDRLAGILAEKLRDKIGV